MQLLLDLLKEQGSTEEYQEALDLIYRLIKCPKDPKAAVTNSELILQTKVDNIELLLELLEHMDMVVGITTSQILTEIHANCGPLLEQAIQDCHTGMTKLLQRLPDASREEVRNQAIVLVQQLTASNEEMKKTVAFNEGFDILFGIIQSEGGNTDGGIVVQDCVQICSNILADSETCQRLFYEMGSDWFLKLADFFDPSVLEKMTARGLYDDDGDEAVQDEMWFEESSRVLCASYAMHALANSLSNGSKKYQNLLGVTSHDLMTNASFWLARRGPYELITPAIDLISKIVSNNEEVRSSIANSVVQISPSKKGTTVPSDFEFPPSTFLMYGWKPLPNEDTKCIALPSLYAEQYIFQPCLWSSRPGDVVCTQEELYMVSEKCLDLLDAMFSIEATYAGNLVTSILAPPPPMDNMDENQQNGPMDIMKPFASLVLNTLLEASVRATSGGNSPGLLLVPLANSQLNVSDVTLVVRCSSVMALMFIHGDSLARELFTAVSTGHTSLAAGQGTFTPVQLLPFLLATAGRAVRAGGDGYTLLVAIVRLLSAAVCSCSRAVKLVLEDPSNLFILDLATAASEATGVPTEVQTIACLFLGICWISLDEIPEDSSGTDDGQLTPKSFLAMIESRVGLSRFADILKRPMAPREKQLRRELFFSTSFKTFYENYVDLIRRNLFDFYASSGATNPERGQKSPEQQIIDMQKAHIVELEKKLENHQQNRSTNGTEDNAQGATWRNSKFEEDILATIRGDLEISEATRKEQLDVLAARDAALEEAVKNEAAITEEANDLRQKLKESESLIAELKKQQSSLSNPGDSNGKEQIMNTTIQNLEADLLSLRKEIANKDEKISILEENLRSPLGYENEREAKIKELEAEVKEQEATISAITLAANKVTTNSSDLVGISKITSLFDLIWNENISGVVQELANKISPGAVEMISQVGLISSLSELRADEDRSNMLQEKLMLLVSVLQEVMNSQMMLARKCSDISEEVGLPVNSLNEAECSSARILECYEKMTSKVRNLRSELEGNNQLKLEFQRAEENRMLSEEEVRKLQDMIASLQEANSTDNANIAKELVDLRGQLGEKTEEMELAKKQLQSINNDLQAQHEHEIANLRSRLEGNAAEERADFDSKLNTLNDKLAEKDKEILELLSQNEKNSKMIHELQKNDSFDQSEEKRQLEKQLTTVKAIAASLEKELEETKADLSTMTLNIDKNDLSINDGGDDLEKLKKESVELRKLSDRLSTVQNELSEKTREHLKLVQESAATTGQLEGLKITLGDLQNELATLRNENESLEKRLSQQKGTLDAQTRDIEKINEELQDNDRVLQEKTRDLQASQNFVVNSVEQISDFAVWIKDALGPYIHHKNQKLDEFNEDILKTKKRCHADGGIIVDDEPIPIIVDKMKKMITETLLSMKSNIENTKNVAAAKENEINAVKEQLQKNFDDMKRQMNDMGANSDESIGTSIMSGPSSPLPNKAPGSPLSSTPGRWKDTADLVHAFTPQAKEIARVHSELLKKQKLLDDLNEEHTDLLSLLAQQELEISVFRDAVQKISRQRCDELDKEVKETAIDKYGSYTEFRT